MKIKITAIIILAISYGICAQEYVPKTGGTFTGNVKVNEVLSVNSSNDGSSAYKFGNDYGQIYYDAQTVGESNRGIYFQEKLSTQRGFHFLNKNGQNLLRINGNGNVGIGILNPQRKLQISNKGASTADQPLKPEKWQVGIGNIDGDDQGEVLIGTYGKQPAIQGHGTGTSYKLLLNPFDGNVGIGTYNPGSWKLAVNGKIRAKEIKVETGWSDFVFYDGYKLPTLYQVEKHIKEKGHLRDIPSAKEVEENGIFLGEMDSKLLQKIEELTLYTIQQEKKLKSQDSKIEKLQKKNEQLTLLNKKFLELESRLEKLESEK